MSFFEPLPPEPPPRERQWAPPLWDSPSEGTIPAVMAVNELVHQSDDAVLVIEYLNVYPNGFTIQMGIHLDPRHSGEKAMRMRSIGPQRFPRVGVRFSDGREAGRRVRPRGTADLPKDEQGAPTEPFIGFHGGGGGSGGWHFGVWVYPLPPDGPLEIFLGLPAAGLIETKVTVDGSAVGAAASQARVVWT